MNADDEYEIKVKLGELPELRQYDIAAQMAPYWLADFSKRAMSRRVWVMEDDAGQSAAVLESNLPRLSMMPYALVMGMLAIGLLVLIRLFVAGGLPLPIFVGGGILLMMFSGLGCCSIALKSWRAAAEMRRWQSERKWVFSLE